MARDSEDELLSLRADYDRDGVVIVRGYLSEAELSELRCRALPLAGRMTNQNHNAGKYKNVLKSLQNYDGYLDAQLRGGTHAQF